MSAYGYVLYAHLASVLIFCLGHGVAMALAFALRRERDPSRLRALLDVSLDSVHGTYIGLAGIFITGAVLSTWRHAWGEVWLLSSLGLFIVTSVVMFFAASRYYGRVRTAVGLAPYRRTRQMQPLGEVQHDALATLLQSRRPLWITVLGSATLLVILWLMLFKGF